MLNLWMFYAACAVAIYGATEVNDQFSSADINSGNNWLEYSYVKTPGKYSEER